MNPDFNVVVSGAGAVGAALALALARQGMRVAVVDSAANGRKESGGIDDGRAFALSVSSCRFLEWLGFRGLLEEHGQAIRSVAVSEGHPGRGAGPGALVFEPDLIAEDSFGRILPAHRLGSVLSRSLAGNGAVSVFASARVAGLERGAASVRVFLDDGRELSGSVLAGCDGRDGLAAGVAGIQRTRKDYRQSALVFAVEHEREHEGRAHQFFMPTGPIAILPMLRNFSSVVWTEAADTADWLSSLENADFLSQLRPRFGEFLGDLELAGKRLLWPLRLSLAESVAADRIALAGDAAHGIHPLAGQGLNLGFRDAAALAEILAAAARRGEDIGRSDVLERYQRQRRFDIASMAAATDAFNFLFSADAGLFRLGRLAGMSALKQSAWMRQALLREAAGLAGRVPGPMSGMPA